MEGVGRNPATGGAERVDHTADQQGSQGTWDPCRKRDAGRQRSEHDAQRSESHQR